MGGGTFMFSVSFWGYLNSLLWITIMIYLATFVVSLYQCVLKTLDQINEEYVSIRIGFFLRYFSHEFCTLNVS